MSIQATNNFVYIIRDEIESEKAGLIIPGVGQEKPHMGIIYSVGGLVRDKRIRASKGRKGAFHKGTGFELEFDGVVYLVLTDDQVIGVL